MLEEVRQIRDRLDRKYFKLMGMRDEAISKAKLYKIMIQQAIEAGDLDKVEEIKGKVEKLVIDVDRYTKVFIKIKKEWEDVVDKF